jgi:hypothetical protein
MARLGAAALLVLLAGCASAPQSPGAFSFGVMGDTPYSDAEERAFLRMMARVGAEPLAFVIHVGDFKAGGSAPCTDDLFERRRAQFDASAHPFIYTPGDNEWTDCRRPSNGAMDPIERLARLRQVFFASRESLGRTRIATDAQDECLAPPPAAECGCGAHPENRAWEYGGVVFVTLNIPGSNDNTGFDAANDREARCRGEANGRWLERAVQRAMAPAARALVVAIQADPWGNSRPAAYRAFLTQLEDAARRLAKPVLFIHGDSHTFRDDAPFAAANLRRLETYGSPFVGWVRVDVDPARPQLFRANPRLPRLVLPAP